MGRDFMVSFFDNWIGKHMRKYLIAGIVLVASLGWQVVVPTTPAFASSIYDNLIEVTDDLYVQDGSNDPIEVTHNYLEYMENLCSPTVYNSFINDVRDASPRNGGWTLFQQTVSGKKYVLLMFSDNSYGTSYASQFWDSSAYGPPYSGIGFSTFYEGFMILGASGNSVTCTGLAMMGSYSGLGVFSTDPYIPVGLPGLEIFMTTWPTTYPSGYAGTVIPTTAPYTGTVDCGGDDPVSMLIPQAGNNGGATLTPISLGRASWSYDLTSSPYMISVMCGSTLAVSYGSVSPSTGTDWVCDIYGDDPPHCVLS